MTISSVSPISHVARIASIAAAAAVPALLLVGCSQTKVIPQAEVQTQAAAALTAKVGQESPPITCPADLEAKVGASEVCAITLDGKVYDVTITVNSIDSSTDKAIFDVSVASTPRA